MIKIIKIIVLSFLLYSCAVSNKIVEVSEEDFKEEVTNILTTDSIFHRSHSGLVVQNIKTGAEIINHKGDQYFTPASNTKLYTFYTAYSVLSDRMIGMKYYENEDSLIIWGTGDPTLLNPRFIRIDYIIPFLSQSDKEVYLCFDNYSDEAYGSGWAWDDYYYAYQTEKSALPIYGNLVRYSKDMETNSPKTTPTYFKQFVSPTNKNNRYYNNRDHSSNKIYYDPEYWQINEEVRGGFPFKVNNVLIANLLESEIGKKVHILDQSPHYGEAINFYTAPTIPLYIQLLQPSNNFVAEQLLLSCSSTLFDTMNVARTIEWSKENLLGELPHDFQWVDGSGLSRYNLTTPQNMVVLLKLIYNKVPEDLLFELLPTGGKSGTIRRWYAADPPFIHAKTGSLRNNHSLSGYLIGDSGEVYVFSFMNSNFYGPSRNIKEGMDKVLRILKANL